MIDSFAYFKFQNSWISPRRARNGSRFNYGLSTFEDEYKIQSWHRDDRHRKRQKIIHKNNVHHHDPSEREDFGNIDHQLCEEDDEEMYCLRDDSVSEGDATENEDVLVWPLTDPQLLLAVPYVRGFDPQTKHWSKFTVWAVCF